MQREKTKAIAECAIMVALAVILNLIKVYEMPQGGTITAAAMAPIVFAALRHRPMFGILTGLVYAGIQMMEFYPPPTNDLLSFVLVVLLDYVVAFGVLGLAGLIADRFKNRRVGALAATAIVVASRFVCHLLSGAIIWGPFYAEGQNPWIYSLLYNGSYMLPELIITLTVVALLLKVISPQKKAE